jgi:predicted nucleic acid-binding protein
LPMRMKTIVPLLVSVVNTGEVCYIFAGRTSEADADRSIREPKQLGIKLVDADWDIAHDAGRFKARHKMSFADCFAAALAKHRKPQSEILWLRLAANRRRTRRREMVLPISAPSGSPGPIRIRA